MRWFCTGSIVALAAVAAHGQTVTVFQSGFEPGEGYATGNLSGQNGWSALLGLNPSFARVTSADSLSGSQSLLLDGRQIAVSAQLGNRGAVGLSNPVAPNRNGAPLRSIEITGRCAIVDSTLNTTHTSWGAINLNGAGGNLVTSVGPLSERGQLEFGWFSPQVLPVQSGVTLEFRHLVDYQTGWATEWMNGQLVYENFAPAFNSGLIPTTMFIDMVSLDLLPFDTQVWFDDLHVSATYVPAPGCRADFNGAGGVTVQDIFDFLAAYFINAASADFNDSGAVTVQDIFDFLAAYFVGCP